MQRMRRVADDVGGPAPTPKAARALALATEAYVEAILRAAVQERDARRAQHALDDERTRAHWRAVAERRDAEMDEKRRSAASDRNSTNGALEAPDLVVPVAVGEKRKRSEDDASARDELRKVLKTALHDMFPDDDDEDDDDEDDDETDDHEVGHGARNDEIHSSLGSNDTVERSFAFPHDDALALGGGDGSNGPLDEVLGHGDMDGLIGPSGGFGSESRRERVQKSNLVLQRIFAPWDRCNERRRREFERDRCLRALLRVSLMQRRVAEGTVASASDPMLPSSVGDRVLDALDGGATAQHLPTRTLLGRQQDTPQARLAALRRLGQREAAARNADSPGDVTLGDVLVAGGDAARASASRFVAVGRDHTECRVLRAKTRREVFLPVHGCTLKHA